MYGIWAAFTVHAFQNTSAHAQPVLLQGPCQNAWDDTYLQHLLCINPAWQAMKEQDYKRELASELLQLPTAAKHDLRQLGVRVNS
jgi:hypothetical protein